ncbi:MAG: SDR family oxidoreductase [Candidatus Hydrogenedentes bacterium]|nr:SDR family oxidoreductase [Candidatus Hydrogenedentota bacterium]
MGNQVVVVTGGARGIGYGIAECFAEKGASLVLADVNGERAQESAERLGALGAAGAIGLECDVSNRAQVAAMVEEACREFGRIDVLVNNAGICPFVDVMDLDPEVFAKTIDVNLMGAYHCTHLVAQKMIAQGEGGRIVFITSLAENVTGPAQVDYGASKGGMRMLMVGFATRLGRHGITCNAIAPGMILTDMTRSHWEQPGPAEEIKHRVPMGRIGVPRDIGHAAVFLASNEAEYVNGITLRVDGGHQAVCA